MSWNARGLILTILLLVLMLLSACAGRQGNSVPEDVSGYVDNEGVRTYYEVIGEGPPLLMLHAFGLTSRDWHEYGYVDGLKDDYRLILMDWRGHGYSDKPLEPEAYSLEMMVSDVVAVLDELGIDKAHVYASGPGQEGYALAKFAPERLISLIAQFILATPTRTRNEEWIAFAKLSPEAMKWQVSTWPHDGVSEERWQQWMNSYVERFEHETFTAYASLEEPGTADIIPKISVPTLVIVSESVANAAQIRQQAQSIPGAKYVGLAPVRGMVAWHVRGDLMLPYITEFLAEVSTEAE